MSELFQSTVKANSFDTATVCGVLQRQCACGEHTIGGGTCSKCAHNRGSAMLSGARAKAAEFNDVPPIVYDVLRSPGKSLEPATRAFMEPRFGHDFSRVRVHTDPRAGESARAVGAEAYTVGSHIVFGSHPQSPDSSAGRELLAHELAHVVQQEHVGEGSIPTRISQPSDVTETHAEQLSRSVLTGERPAPNVSGSSSAILARRVIPRLVHCTPGSDGAPADPVSELNTVVLVAEIMARAASGLLKLNAQFTREGNQQVGNTVDQAFNDRFGEPAAVGSKFMNRLTGALRPTMEIALSEEMDLTAKRYDLIAGQLGKGFINYLCMSTTRSFGGCTITDCSSDAWACPNVNAIFLCPGFWGGDPSTHATLLIHETAHMIWERVFHGAPGSGGNFRHAECYASLVSDIFGLPHGAPPCPPT